MGLGRAQGPPEHVEGTELTWQPPGPEVPALTPSVPFYKLPRTVAFLILVIHM